MIEKSVIELAPNIGIIRCQGYASHRTKMIQYSDEITATTYIDLNYLGEFQAEELEHDVVDFFHGDRIIGPKGSDRLYVKNWTSGDMWYGETGTFYFSTSEAQEAGRHIKTAILEHIEKKKQKWEKVALYRKIQ